MAACDILFSVIILSKPPDVLGAGTPSILFLLRKSLLSASALGCEYTVFIFSSADT